MKGNFGKTNFGGIIMHGMNNFGLISRMLTDWAYPAGAVHRRLETRWVKPVRPGDTIQPTGIVKSKQVTAKFALGPDRRHGAQPERREGRHRRGHGRVPAGLNFPAISSLTRLDMGRIYPNQMGLKGLFGLTFGPPMA